MNATASIAGWSTSASPTSLSPASRWANVPSGRPASASAARAISGDERAGARVRRVALDDDRAAGRERGRGVAADGAEGEREVARAEDRDRADRDEHAPQVGPRRGLRVGVGQVDDRAEVLAGGDEVGERPQLHRGALELAAQAPLGQPGLATRRRPTISSPRASQAGRDRAQPVGAARVVARAPGAAPRRRPPRAAGSTSAGVTAS